VNVEGLRYAVAVGRIGSFTAAARDHGVTQPALSNAIARLEAELGDRLFDRSTRGVTPTVFGERMLPLIERAVTAIGEIEAEARSATGREPDLIRLGVSPLIDGSLVSAAFALVRGRSGADLVLHEANMDELRDDLVAGRLDIIFVPAVQPMPRFKHAAIGREPVVVVSADNASQDPVDVGDIGGDPLILLPDTCGLTRFTETLLEAHHVELNRYPGEASSYRGLEEWARLGLGAAVMPHSKLAADTESYRDLLQDGERVEITYEAIWNPSSRHAAELAAVAAALRPA
jgi:DNA-binding transcriptional LysR family regulator